MLCKAAMMSPFSSAWAVVRAALSPIKMPQERVKMSAAADRTTRYLAVFVVSLWLLAAAALAQAKGMRRSERKEVR